jgi:diaminopimelate epimerase
MEELPLFSPRVSRFSVPPIPFDKYQGSGNDFIILDARLSPPMASWHEWAPRLCDRRSGIGADGLLLLDGGRDQPLRMRVINADGSEPEMCGNGLRCAVRHWGHLGHVTPGETTTVMTGDGARKAQITPQGDIRTWMGHPRFKRAEIPIAGPTDAEFDLEPLPVETGSLAFSGVSLGNPHIVAFVEELRSVPLERWGPALEHHPLFPARTNVEIAQIQTHHEVLMRVWERGAGLTAACGTGACAVAVTGIRQSQLKSPVTVHMPGGSVTVEWQLPEEVTLTGPAARVFSGHFSFDDFLAPSSVAHF